MDQAVDADRGRIVCTAPGTIRPIRAHTAEAAALAGAGGLRIRQKGVRVHTGPRRSREYRVRQKLGDEVVGVRVTPLVVEALIERDIDSGVPEKQAEANALDRSKIAEALAEVALQWAQRYMKEKGCRHA